MRILIAPDKFKGACSALNVGENLKKGIEKILPNAICKIIPLADGGEGTLDALASSLKAEWRETPTKDPLGRDISALYLYDKKSKHAIIEMSRASGFELLTDAERCCMKSSSYGTGIQIVDAINLGATKITLTVGGTATNDAGMGIAEALGFKFFDENNNILKSTGENLIKVKTIDASDNILKGKQCVFFIATDVNNPFYGENGAARVFAKQKGANECDIEILDAGLRNFNEVLIKAGYPSVENIVGGGAGGGVSGGLFSLFGAQIFSAAQWILEVNKIGQLLDNTDILITGEGKVDSQTWGGKLISKMLQLAQNRNIPVIIICGSLENIDKIPVESSIIHISSIIHKPMTLEQAIYNTEQLLREHGVLLGHFLSKTLPLNYTSPK